MTDGVEINNCVDSNECDFDDFSVRWFDDIISINDTCDGVNDDTRSVAMDIIQLMRYFEVNIRICQPEK